MRLIHLAAGRKQSIWAVVGEDGRCQVLEMLLVQALEEHPDLAETMMALLFEVVPDAGPPLGDPRKAKRLYRDILFELKVDRGVGVGKHVGLRVVFFFDEPATIICTNAFYKSHSTPQTELDAALVQRRHYFEAKELNALAFESLEESDDEQTE